MANAINKDLRYLTEGERLWMHRRQRAWTQAEAAKKFKVPFKSYCAAELDKSNSIHAPSDSKAYKDRGLQCALARRRMGRGLRKCAELLGVSHVTLLSREASRDRELVKMWERQGFRF